MNNGIKKEDEPKLEIERRNSLAKHLIHQHPERQRSYLKRLKTEELRQDIRERMRQALAVEISLMDTNMRNLRMARLAQRCRLKLFDQDFFKDINGRVNRLLEQQEQSNG